MKFARTSDKDSVNMSRKQLKESTITIHDDLKRKKQKLLNRIKMTTEWLIRGPLKGSSGAC